MPNFGIIPRLIIGPDNYSFRRMHSLTILRKTSVNLLQASPIVPSFKHVQSKFDILSFKRGKLAFYRQDRASHNYSISILLV